jgi:hypothetical protein
LNETGKLPEFNSRPNAAQLIFRLRFNPNLLTNQLLKVQYSCWALNAKYEEVVPYFAETRTSFAENLMQMTGNEYTHYATHHIDFIMLKQITQKRIEEHVSLPKEASRNICWVYMVKVAGKNDFCMTGKDRAI